LSATPSKKLLQQGRAGKIGLSTLPRRFHGQPLPVPKLAWVKKAKLPKQLPPQLLAKLKTLVTTHRVLLFVPDIDWLVPITNVLRQHLKVEIQSVHAQDEQREAKVLAFRAGSNSSDGDDDNFRAWRDDPSLCGDRFVGGFTKIWIAMP
jgi:competence protein ComFA